MGYSGIDHLQESLLCLDFIVKNFVWEILNLNKFHFFLYCAVKIIEAFQRFDFYLDVFKMVVFELNFENFVFYLTSVLLKKFS